MKTPRIPGAVRLVVRPPQRGPRAIHPSDPPTDGEAWAVVQAIRPRFEYYARRYDTRKYWPRVYELALRAFRRPKRVLPRTLREALLWKYGHLGKAAIPGAHERLISQVQRSWRATVAVFPKPPDEAFMALDRQFGGSKRFITVAFLVHLLHPRRAPIIDQDNFRAVNALMVAVRPGWRSRAKPSRYADLTLVAAFMETVLAVWARRDLKSAPNARELDKFLMMYGKAIKRADSIQGS
jgi:hypothetical protein